MPDTKYPYPFIECDHHEGPQRALLVCDHVLEGEAIYLYQEATDTDIGDALCRRCHRSLPRSIKQGKRDPHIKMVCEKHFTQRMKGDRRINK